MIYYIAGMSHLWRGYPHFFGTGKNAKTGISKTITKKLNNEIKKYPELYNYSVNDLLKNLDSLPKDSATIIKNNAGGVSNHEIFFDIMTGKETKMNEKLESLINEVVRLLPEGNTFFASEKNSSLKTKQDYDLNSTDSYETGVYDRNRDFFTTVSPLP